MGGDIFFYKVKSHLGVFGNEAADHLAKEALDPDQADAVARFRGDLHGLNLVYRKREDGDYLAKPVFIYAKTVVGSAVSRTLAADNSGTANQPPSSQHLGTLTDPAQYGYLAEFTLKCRIERLKLPSWRWEPSSEDRCPRCRCTCNIDIIHFVLICRATIEARAAAATCLESFPEFAIQQDLVSALRNPAILKLVPPWTPQTHRAPPSIPET